MIEPIIKRSSLPHASSDVDLKISVVKADTNTLTTINDYVSASDIEALIEDVLLKEKFSNRKLLILLINHLQNLSNIRFLENYFP